MKLKNKKRFAILCSGGSAPGMATCIVAFVKKCLSIGVEPVAFANGFKGLHDNQFINISSNHLFDFIDNGSALIGTSRCNEFKESIKYRKECVNNLHKNKIDGLVVVGGDGSYHGAYELSKLGIHIIAVPATIDNDVPSTAYTIGFDTCLNTICRCVSDVNDVFISHNGIALIELMGRCCPDVTVRSAIANNATYMVTKYSKLKKEGFLKIAQKGFNKGKTNITFLITEQLYPKEGTQSLDAIAKWLEKKSHAFTRHVVLGYMQRGGKPSARDRLLANYMINIGIEQLMNSKGSKAICRKARETVAIDLSKAMTIRVRSWNKKLVSIYNKINQE